MSKKISVIKVRLLILEHETNRILAGQRDATLNISTKENDWNIDADSIFVESDEAHAALTKAFLEGKDVKVRLEFSPTRKYIGSCTIERFKPDAPYNDLAQYALLLQSNSELIIVEPDMRVI